MLLYVSCFPMVFQANLLFYWCVFQLFLRLTLFHPRLWSWKADFYKDLPCWNGLGRLCFCTSHPPHWIPASMVACKVLKLNLFQVFPFGRMWWSWKDCILWNYWNHLFMLGHATRAISAWPGPGFVLGWRLVLLHVATCLFIAAILWAIAAQRRLLCGVTSKLISAPTPDIVQG